MEPPIFSWSTGVWPWSFHMALGMVKRQGVPNYDVLQAAVFKESPWTAVHLGWVLHCPNQTPREKKRIGGW